MPTPNSFEELRRAGRLTAGEAWGMALEHAKGQWRKGGGAGDPLVDKVVQFLGGYREIALCDTSKLGFLERRFCEHYDDLETVEATRVAVPELTSDYSKPRRLVGDRNGGGKLLGVSRVAECVD